MELMRHSSSCEASFLRSSRKMEWDKSTLSLSVMEEDKVEIIESGDILQEDIKAHSNYIFTKLKA